MALKYVDDKDFQIEGKKVIARFDFNVPIDKDEPNLITDSSRIDEAIPTIKYILEKKPSKFVLMSHLGRPNGLENPKYSLEPIARDLAKKLNEEVILTESAVDAGINTLLKLNSTRLILLQNLRFHPGEESNDPGFCKTISKFGDFYVNDAFGTAHRKHASTFGINAFFKNKGFGGFLLKKEIIALDKIISNPKKPLMAIMGGSKVGDKIKILERLLPLVDQLFIGGAMVYPFLRALGRNVGKSLCSNSDVELAKKLIKSKSFFKVILPIDHVIANDPNSIGEIWKEENIPESKMALDIGPSTIALFQKKLSTAKTILWNGPMGMFEKDNFSHGTINLAKFIPTIDAFSLVGGGDSLSALKVAGISDKISHISTGGGASLEYLEKGTLPGIQALKFGVEH